MTATASGPTNTSTMIAKIARPTGPNANSSRAATAMRDRHRRMASTSVNSDVTIAAAPNSARPISSRVHFARARSLRNAALRTNQRARWRRNGASTASTSTW